MSLFPTLQKLAPKATLLYDCFPGLLTRQAPSQFDYGRFDPLNPPVSPYYDNATPPGPCPAGNAVVCWQRFTGTDPITNFPYPSSAPLFAYAGGVVEGFGMYVIDQYFGFDAADPVADFPNTIGVTTNTNVVRGSSMTTLKANHYNHVQNNFQAGVQSHFTLYRNTSATGFVDLDKCGIDAWIKIPDHSSLLNSSYKFRVIHDYKTVNDFRYVVHLIYADSNDAAAFGVPLGTIGIMVNADNNANGSLTLAEFVRMKWYPTTPSEAVPTDFFKSTVFWDRSTSYSDVDSGRFVYCINDRVIIDVNADSVAQYNIDHPLSCTNNGGNPATNCVNRHMGVNSSPIQRMFLVSNYFGGIGGNDVQFDLARLQIWDDAPFELAAA